MRLTFLSLLTCLFLGSCLDPCYEVRGGLGIDGMNINLFHRGNNEYFYPENTFNAAFNKDSLKISSSDGRVLQPGFVLDQDRVDLLKRYYKVSISPIFDRETDQAAFVQEKTKYIYLQYNFNTADTLKLVYKAKKTKCTDLYQYLNIFYHDTLLASITNDTYTEFILKH